LLYAKSTARRTGLRTDTGTTAFNRSIIGAGASGESHPLVYSEPAPAGKMSLLTPVAW
jgi:hypothetical protein